MINVFVVSIILWHKFVHENAFFCEATARIVLGIYLVFVINPPVSQNKNVSTLGLQKNLNNNHNKNIYAI